MDNSQYGKCNECIISQLIEHPFLDCTKDQQHQIIKNGRPTPLLPKLTKKYQNTNRRFNTRHYTRYEWLTGSSKMNKLFCWYCLLFDKKRNVNKNLWASIGYSDMRQLVMAATRHAFSQSHHRNTIEYHKFKESINENGDNFDIPRPFLVKKANIKRCIINQILGMPFLERTLNEQLDIVRNGRPTPPMPLLFMYDLETNTKIGFNSENYLKFKWMAGSQKLNRLYCWPCLLFADTSLNELWISIGFNKMDNFYQSTEDHIKSHLHIEHEQKYDEFNSNFNTGMLYYSETDIKSDLNEPLKTENIKLEAANNSNELDNFIEEHSNDYNFIEGNSFESKDISDNDEEENSNNQDEINILSKSNQDQNNCVIRKILKNSFNNRPINEQKQILLKGRPLPDTLQFSKLTNNFYNKYEWLTASAECRKFYCWYCLLLKDPYESSFWAEEGVNHARNFPKRIERHQNSEIHFNSFRKYEEIITRLEIYVQPVKLSLGNKEKPTLQELLEKYKHDKDIVVELLRIKFSDRSNSDQRNILEKGRPRPNLPNLYGIYCGSKRQFRSVYYDKYEWLCGSEKLNKLFCWYCLLCNKSVWGREGVTNICKLTKSLKNHNLSLSHEQCVIECKQIGKTKEEFETSAELTKTQEIISNALSNKNRCLINEVLGYPFSNRTIENRIEIVKNDRPIPDASDGEPFIQNFFSINYFKYNWLTGSKKLKKLFCWPCLLFADASSTNVWVQTGFDNVRKLSTAASKHEHSKTHQKYVDKLYKFKQKFCPESNIIKIENNTEIS